MTNIESKVEKLIAPKIENLGYELYDVEYVKEGKDYYLRIYIESENGISLDDCEKVSNEITDILDKEDYIKEQYFLEVSSTGVEKVLKKDKHLEANLGVEVQVKLFKPINKNKQYQGILKDFNENEVIIETNEERMALERKNISQIKTIYNW
ncbi:MAG: ribosome maturation factor RimP [Clostridia bacterium]|nr:ribosome maturation factor RimP [Clostridia bacterium]